MIKKATQYCVTKSFDPNIKRDTRKGVLGDIPTVLAIWATRVFSSVIFNLGMVPIYSERNA